jgi:hypothetical protein
MHEKETVGNEARINDIKDAKASGVQTKCNGKQIYGTT